MLLFQIIVNQLQYALADINLFSRYSVERFVQGVFGNGHGLFLEPETGFGQADPVDPAVVGRGNALYQLQFFEIIHQPRDAGLVAKRRITEFLLTLSVLFPQMIKNTPLFNRDRQTGTIEPFL
jgi:hypothetical protein